MCLKPVFVGCPAGPVFEHRARFRAVGRGQRHTAARTQERAKIRSGVGACTGAHRTAHAKDSVWSSRCRLGCRAVLPMRARVAGACVRVRAGGEKRKRSSRWRTDSATKRPQLQGAPAGRWNVKTRNENYSPHRTPGPNPKGAQKVIRAENHSFFTRMPTHTHKQATRWAAKVVRVIQTCQGFCGRISGTGIELGHSKKPTYAARCGWPCNPDGLSLAGEYFGWKGIPSFATWQTRGNQHNHSFTIGTCI